MKTIPQPQDSEYLRPLIKSITIVSATHMEIALNLNESINTIIAFFESRAYSYQANNELGVTFPYFFGRFKDKQMITVNNDLDFALTGLNVNLYISEDVLTQCRTAIQELSIEPIAATPS